jgi:hypothetical protein
MGWPRILRWRYSLRALFVFVALFMVWGGYHANRGWRQRAAEAVLREHGATIYLRTGGWKAKHSFIGRGQELYRGVVYLLWGDAQIYAVTLSGPLDTDVIDALVSLPALQALTLAPRRYTAVEDLQIGSGHFRPTEVLPEQAIRRILDGIQTRGLSLIGWKLDDDSCRAIAQRGNIEGIGLIGCTLSEEGFAELMMRPRFRSIGLTCCPVTGEKLATLAGSPTLERLSCSQTRVGKEFAKYVARCKNLQRLSVTEMTADDEFAACLRDHPSISELVLYGRITDRTADMLAEMPSLQSGRLGGRAISDEAIGRLKLAKPGIVVSK